LTSVSPLPNEGPLSIEAASSDPKAPETVESRGRDKVEGSLEGSGSTQSPPPAESRDHDGDKKRKCQEDLVSLCISKKVPASLYAMLGSDS
jgi:hypothetical protein